MPGWGPTAPPHCPGPEVPVLGHPLPLPEGARSVLHPSEPSPCSWGPGSPLPASQMRFPPSASGPELQQLVSILSLQHGARAGREGGGSPACRTRAPSTLGPLLSSVFLQLSQLDWGGLPTPLSLPSCRTRAESEPWGLAVEEAEASADLKGKKKQTGLCFLWPTGSLGPSQEEADVLEGVTLSHPEPPAGGDRVEIYPKGLGGHPGPEGSSPFKGNSDSHPWGGRGGREAMEAKGAGPAPSHLSSKVGGGR